MGTLIWIAIALVPLMFIAVVIGFIVFVVKNAHSKLNSGTTFEQYRAENPQLVQGGRVRCKHCGGGDIFLQRFGHIGTTVVNSHVCRSCGTSLFKSRHSG